MTRIRQVLPSLIVHKAPGLNSGAIVRAVVDILPDVKVMSVYPTIYRLRGVRIFEHDGRYYAKSALPQPESLPNPSPTGGGAPPE